MAQVPTYDNPQVELRPLVAPKQDFIAPGLFTGSGTTERLGNAMLRTGAEASDIAAQMQERENADLIFRAETSLKDELVKFDTDARNRKGADAKGLTQDTDKFFEDAAQKHGAGLTNNVQRRVFNEQVQKLRVSTVNSLAKHEQAELRQSFEDSTSASIVGAINRAAANANDWTIAEQEIKNVRDRVQVLAKINGKPPEWTEAYTGEKLTLLHKQVIQQLVATNPAAVKEYFEKYKDQIDGSQRAELGEFAKKATATSIGEQTAAEVWAKQGPKSSGEPVALATMEESIRTALKGNDDAIDKAIKGVRERAVAFKDQRKEEANALEASVNGNILKGMTAAQLRRSPEYIKLSASDPEAARKIDAYMENREYTAEARAAARAQRADAEESRRDRRLQRESLDTALRLSDPDKLVQMTREEVVNLLPTMGAHNTQALLARWDSLKKSDENLREARIDKQDFDRIALTRGLRPNEKSKSEDDKDRLVRLQSQVENAIDVEQRAKRRPLTRDEKTAIMEREIDNNVYIHRLILPDVKDQPVATLSPKEQENAYVIVGPKQTRVMLKDIPADFRARAIAARRKEGLGTSEQQLGELWLLNKGK